MTSKAKTKSTNLAAAFLEFQRNVRPAELDKMNDHYRRSGGGAYASLSSMKRAANPALHACGLAYWFESVHEDSNVRVDMTLEHAATGERRETVGAWFPVQRGKGNPAHAVKSVVTYAKRATFQDALGLDAGPGEDDDGNNAGTGESAPMKTPARAVTFKTQVNERRLAVGWTVDQVVELAQSFGVEKVDLIAKDKQVDFLAKINESTP